MIILSKHLYKVNSFDNIKIHELRPKFKVKMFKSVLQKCITIYTANIKLKRLFKLKIVS